MEWKSYRELFEENYIATEVVDKKGREKIKYMYCAPWYYWDIEASDLVSKKRWIFLLAVVNVLSFFCAGLIYSSNVGIAVIEVPALFALISMFFLHYGIIRFLLNGLRMTKIAFESISRNLKVFSLVFAVFSLFSGVANIWISFGAMEWSVLCVSLLYCFSAVAACLMFHVFSRINFISGKNKEYYSQER